MEKVTKKRDNLPTQAQTRTCLSAATCSLRKLNSKREFRGVILERALDYQCEVFISGVLTDDMF